MLGRRVIARLAHGGIVLGDFTTRPCAARLLDPAPTILHYLGLPVPEYMDGRVLTDAFTDEFNAANPVVYSQVGPGDGVGSDSIYTDEEEALVMQKLRDLGYVA